jgi:hypothetical protein
MKSSHSEEEDEEMRPRSKGRSRVYRLFDNMWSGREFRDDHGPRSERAIVETFGTDQPENISVHCKCRPAHSVRIPDVPSSRRWRSRPRKKSKVAVLPFFRKQSSAGASIYWAI